VRKLGIHRHDGAVVVSEVDLPETESPEGPEETVGTREGAPRSAAGPPVGDPDVGVVPDEVVARAKAAFATRAKGALAALVLDSALHAEPSAGARTLRFVDRSVSVKVTVTGEGVWRTITCRVVPGSLRVQLEREGAMVAPAHEVARGCFGFAPMPRGLVRLRMEEPDGSASARTEWFLV
jgi:hypothetical protein